MSKFNVYKAIVLSLLCFNFALCIRINYIVNAVDFLIRLWKSATAALGLLFSSWAFKHKYNSTVMNGFDSWLRAFNVLKVNEKSCLLWNTLCNLPSSLKSGETHRKLSGGCWENIMSDWKVWKLFDEIKDHPRSDHDVERNKWFFYHNWRFGVKKIWKIVGI